MLFFITVFVLEEPALKWSLGQWKNDRYIGFEYIEDEFGGEQTTGFLIKNKEMNLLYRIEYDEAKQLGPNGFLGFKDVFLQRDKISGELFVFHPQYGSRKLRINVSEGSFCYLILSQNKKRLWVVSISNRVIHEIIFLPHFNKPAFSRRSSHQVQN